MTKKSMEMVERWLRNDGSSPGEYELIRYLLLKLEEMYPERRDSEGTVIEPAGIPPQHAYFLRATRELAQICARRCILREGI